MKLLLGLFMASCVLWALSYLVGYLMGSAGESDLKLSIAGHVVFDLQGWKADAASLPLVMLLLWVAYIILRPEIDRLCGVLWGQ